MHPSRARWPLNSPSSSTRSPSGSTATATSGGSSSTEATPSISSRRRSTTPARGGTEWEDRPHPGPLRLRRRFDRHWAARRADTKHHGRSPEPIRALAARCSRAHQLGWLEPSGGPSAVRSRPDVLSLARAHGVKGGRSRLGTGARRRRRFDAFSASSASCTRGTAAWCAHRHHRPPRRPLTTEVLEAEHAPWAGEGAVVGCAARRVAKRAAPRRRGRRQ
jgi:hypothetical protein